MSWPSSCSARLGKGSVRLGENPEHGPIVAAPPLPDDANERFAHAFQAHCGMGADRSGKARSGATQIDPIDLTASDAPAQARAAYTISYGHMTSTCPMGAVLDSDCRVLGIDGLRVADASIMPTIPSGNTYLGCVMVAETRRAENDGGNRSSGRSHLSLNPITLKKHK